LPRWCGWLRLAAVAAFACVSVAPLVLGGGDPAAEVFDFVVVGGGSTGSVVAARLGEAGHTVLVLEAGGATQESLGGAYPVAGRHTIFDIPLGWVQILMDHAWSKQFQWEVPADPPPALARGLGGCGIHNAMVYMRGRPFDFETWGAGWAWRDVLPVYRKSEANANYAASSVHGSDGPVTVTSVPLDSLSRAFLEAGVAAGLRRVSDFNGADATAGEGAASREGVGEYQFNIRDGVRDSSTAAYLGEGLRPPSVTVRTRCVVSRLLFEPGTRRAMGVEYVRGKNPTAAAPRARVSARHEVIVSAGAVNTPKLLMLSGVGERSHLEKHGIEIVHHSPHVGRGLADGVYAIMQWATRASHFVRCRLDVNQQTSGADRPPGPARAAQDAYCREQLARYAAGERNASVFGTPGMSVGGFLRSPFSGGADPDVQLALHPWDKYDRPWPSSFGGIATLEMANNRPKSRGRVTLRSGDFLDPPAFEGVYLADPNDTLPLQWAVREMRRIAATPPLSEMFVSELVPGEAVTSDAALHDAVSCGPSQFRALGRPACDRSTLPVNHLAGSCRLGEVVDLRLKLIGVQGVRIADASVMPKPPSGNTHATCVMVGERAAEFILAEHPKP
jgi:choline dehydrogenase